MKNIFVFHCCKKRKRDRRTCAYISQITSDGVTVKGRIASMELREGQGTNAKVTLKTKGGHPAKYQAGTEQWVSSDPAVSVTQDASDPLKARVVGVDGSNNAAALVTFTCDGDPDDDQSRDVVATLDVICTQGEAVTAEVETDTPTDEP